MANAMRIVLLAGALAIVSGCVSDRPHDYGRQRPPVDQLDSRDRGLQSKDIVTASDQMAAELLSSWALQTSPVQWTIVVDRTEDVTTGRRFGRNFDIFLERLRTNLAQQGQGRITLIENRDRFYALRARELDLPRDQFQQGSGAQPAAGRIQPEYVLYAKAMDWPGMGTDYYFLEFVVTHLQSGAQPFVGRYEVRVAR